MLHREECLCNVCAKLTICKRRQAEACLHVQVIVMNLLAHMKKTVPIPGSFAQLLMSTRHPDGINSLSDEAMLAEVSALFFAGADTTGHTGTWIL